MHKCLDCVGRGLAFGSSRVDNWWQGQSVTPYEPIFKYM